MRVPFVKMHGAGNDFIVLRDPPPQTLAPARIAALCDRHTGIGCDQLIVVGHAPGVAATMAIYNADGSESGACGNATRCVADLLRRAGGPARMAIRTAAGTLLAEIGSDGLVTVDMGRPALGWRDIPLARAADTLHVPLPGDPAAVSMGNPHVTFFGQSVDAVTTLGPRYETDALFPERVNVGVAEVLAADRMRLRVWERGAGLTLACGSGACAAVVNAHRRGLCGRTVRVTMDGGALTIAWRADDHVLMTGPVATSYEGTFDQMEPPSP